jgi:glycosyltransferase involved in cell wall biosynthesis
MATGTFRVLADLSYAALRYCGIAQESRFFLKTLWQLPAVEPTGLVFARDHSVLRRRFRRGRSLDRRLEYQALYLQALADGPPAAGWRKWWHLAGACYRLLCSRSVATDRLDNHAFWDAAWRNLFARSLADSDIDLARHCPLLLANLSGLMLELPTFWGRRTVRLDTREFDFVLFHNATPVRVSPGTHKLVRYYDLIPGIRPDLVSCPHAIRNHFRNIRLCQQDSTFVCISESARDDLVSAFPQLAERTACIPVVLSDAYYPDPDPARLPQILDSRKSSVAARHPPGRLRNIAATGKMPPYLIMASTLEPRKNYVYLVRAFEQLLARQGGDLCLVIVGNPGWKYHETTRAIKPLIERGRLFHLEDVPTDELRVLYTHARALVFPSLYEGFGYTPLEAMCCHTPVIVSDIAAHRFVHGDAALYCDPYRTESLVAQLERLLYPDNAALREELIARGRQRVQRYSPQAVGQQWLCLFDALQSRAGGRPHRTAMADRIEVLDFARGTRAADDVVPKAA